MKKIFFLLLTTATLVACGTNTTNLNSMNNNETNKDNQTETNEVELDLSDITSFSEEYNSKIYGGGEIDPTAEIDETRAQVLFTSNEYGIVAVYEDDSDKVNRYSFIFTGADQAYKDAKGESFDAFLLIAEIFGVDKDNIIKKMNESFEKDRHVLIENDHTIMFFNHKLIGNSQFDMTVEFVTKF